MGDTFYCLISLEIVETNFKIQYYYIFLFQSDLPIFGINPVAVAVNGDGPPSPPHAVNFMSAATLQTCKLLAVTTFRSCKHCFNITHTVYHVSYWAIIYMPFDLAEGLANK